MFLNALAVTAILAAVVTSAVCVGRDEIEPWVDHKPAPWMLPSAIVGALWLIFG